MVLKSHYGVHRTHCCIKHGCKYGDEDCPVTTGEIKQDYECEDCRPGDSFKTKEYLINFLDLSPNAQAKYVETFKNIQDPIAIIHYED